MEELERKMEILRPAWHKRDPDPKKDYGVGGVVIRFWVRGKKGAISWSIYTGWMLPETYAEWTAKGIKPREKDYTAAAIIIHSVVPFVGDEEPPGECDLLPGKKCHSDAGFLAGDALFDRMVKLGEDEVWRTLEEWYENELAKKKKVVNK